MQDFRSPHEYPGDGNVLGVSTTGSQLDDLPEEPRRVVATEIGRLREHKKVGYSRLAAGRSLLKIRHELEPYGKFVKWINEEYLQGTATVYRLMDVVRKITELTSTRVIDIAVAEGIEDVTPEAIKKLHQTETLKEGASDEAIAAFLTRAVEEDRKAKANEKVLALGELEGKSFRFVVNALKKLPEKDRPEWVLGLASKLLAEVALERELVVAEKAPDSYRRVKGRPSKAAMNEIPSPTPPTERQL